ncbi:MAG: bifunctional diguanylate cyclase/phosphodiesterase [Candidatus Nanopelagicales bacterium]
MRVGSSFRVRLLVAVAWTVAAVAVLVMIVLQSSGTDTTFRARALAALALAAAAFTSSVSCLERARRDRGRGRTAFLLLAFATGALLGFQAVANLITLSATGVYPPLVDAVPLAVFGVPCLVAVAIATWPFALDVAERRAVVWDLVVGSLGLLIVWVMLVVPAQPARGSTLVRWIMGFGSVVEFAGVVMVLGLAAAARRRGFLPIVPVILLQLAVLVYAGVDTLADVLPFGDRATSATWSSAGFVVSAGLVALAALRRSDEQEGVRQLWVRDAWSSVVPLSPVPIAAGVLLVSLASGPVPSGLTAAALALILFLVITAVLWLRLTARGELRRAQVTVAATTFRQATDQPWFQTLIQNSRDVVLVVDRRNRLIYASPSFCAHVGSTLDEMVGRDLATLLPPLTLSAVRAAQRFPDRPAHPLEISLVDHSGAPHDMQFHVAPLAGLGVDGFVLTGQDVTDSRRMRILLGESRRRDRLTGLLNAEAFAGAVQEAQTWSDPRQLAVVVYDVCDFRAINDARGRESGELILQAVATRLEQAPGPIIAVGRLGGDGFAALLRDSAPDVAAARLTDHLRGALTLVDIPGQEAVTVRLAAGYSTSYSDAERAVDLLEQADLAAARSLAGPHLPLVRFEFSMRDELLAEWEQMADIERGLAAGDFVPHYQPIVRLRDGMVVAVEALARRRLPDGSLQLPEEFIPVAERVGQVARIDGAIRTKALADLRTLNRTWPHLTVSLNVAPAVFDAGFAGMLAAEVAAAGVATRSVVFEFTETTVAESAELARAVLSELRAEGFGVALDDFGTGFSSLSGLRDLDVDILKIDQMFVADLAHSTKALALMRAIIEVGRGLGVVTVAEGVRTIEQADLLRGMGCDRAQGYLQSEPLSFDDLLAWLSTRATSTARSWRH